ncbi:MAG: hypothetical protein E6Q40_12330 [Cupriavidus sp.]|nr:MAG: hypothetical protein E6Q40_12330 [Cupriavidus sp.]
MISLALGLLVIAGAISIFTGSKQGLRAQDSAAQMQESIRYATDYLAGLIRSADLWNGIDPAFIRIGSHSISGPKSSVTCNGDWIVRVNQGLQGYHGESAPPIDCVSPADYVPQSDMLAVRRIDPDTFTAVEQIRDKNNSRRIYLRSRLGLDGYLYQGNRQSEAEQQIPGGHGVLDHEYDFQLLFLRRCIVKTGGTCAASSTTPTLTSLQLQSDGSVSQVTLVQNVEQLKFEYGVDSNGDRAVDRYQTAAQVTEWNKVLSMRTYLIIRGDAPDHFRDQQIYAMGEGFCHGPRTSTCQSRYGGFERYQRRLITQEVLIRNRQRR